MMNENKWKVGDKCWYLTSRGTLKKGAVSRTVKHLHTDEWLVVEVSTGAHFDIRLSHHYYCAQTPEPLIVILRNRAAIRLERAKKELVAAQRAVDSFDSRIQAMLDAALEGEKC